MSKKSSYDIGRIGERRFRETVINGTSLSDHLKKVVWAPYKAPIARFGKGSAQQAPGADFWVHIMHEIGDVPVEVKTTEWKELNHALVSLSAFSEKQREDLAKFGGWVFLTVLGWMGKKRRNADFLIPWGVLRERFSGKHRSIKTHEFLNAEELLEFGWPADRDGVMATWRAKPRVLRAFYEDVAARAAYGLRKAAYFLRVEEDDDYTEIANAWRDVYTALQSLENAYRNTQ